MPRHFRTLPGKTLALPQNLIAGPGRTNMRMKAGDIITLDDAACIREQRFINGRLRAGDLEELAQLPADAPAPHPEMERLRPAAIETADRHVPDPYAQPSGPMGLAMHDMTAADVARATKTKTSKEG